LPFGSVTKSIGIDVSKFQAKLIGYLQQDPLTPRIYPLVASPVTGIKAWEREMRTPRADAALI